MQSLCEKFGGAPHSDIGSSMPPRDGWWVSLSVCLEIFKFVILPHDAYKSRPKRENVTKGRGHRKVPGVFRSQNSPAHSIL